MDVLMPDGTTITGVPEGITQSDLLARYGKFSSSQPQEAALPSQPPTGLASFAPAIMRGGRGLASLMGDVLPAMAGKVVGADEYAKKQMQEAAAYGKETEKLYPSAVPSYTNIKDAGDFVTYVVEAVGEAVPTMIPSLFTGGAASVAGRGAVAAARVAAERAAATSIAEGVTAEAAKDAAMKAGLNAAQREALKYQTVGALAGSAAQNVPDVYQGLYEKGYDNLGAALLFGGFNAALDAVTPINLLRKSKLAGISENEIKGAWYKRAGKGALEGLVSEGVTESLQEMSSAAAEKFVDSHNDFFTPQNFERFINAGLKGGLGGAGISAATNVAFGRKEAEVPPPPLGATPPTDSPIVGTIKVNVGGKESTKVTRQDGSVDIDGVQVTPPTGIAGLAPQAPEGITTLVPPAQPVAQPVAQPIVQQEGQAQDIEAMMREIEGSQPSETTITPVNVEEPTIVQPEEKLNAPETPETQQAAPQEQQAPTTPVTWDTIQPGQEVTLYRGENQENVKEGEWWTTDKAKAEKYGPVTEVTLPSETIGKHSVKGHGGPDEFVFPTEGNRPTDLAQKPEVTAPPAITGGPSTPKGPAAPIEKPTEAAPTPAPTTETEEKPTNIDEVIRSYRDDPDVAAGVIADDLVGQTHLTAEVRQIAKTYLTDGEDAGRTQFKESLQNPNSGFALLGLTQPEMDTYFKELDQYLTEKSNVFREPPAPTEGVALPKLPAGEYKPRDTFQHEGRTWQVTSVLHTGKGLEASTVFEKNKKSLTQRFEIVQPAEAKTEPTEPTTTEGKPAPEGKPEVTGGPAAPTGGPTTPIKTQKKQVWYIVYKTGRQANGRVDNVDYDSEQEAKEYLNKKFTSPWQFKIKAKTIDVPVEKPEVTGGPSTPTGGAPKPPKVKLTEEEKAKAEEEKTKAEEEKKKAAEEKAKVEEQKKKLEEFNKQPMKVAMEEGNADAVASLLYGNAVTEDLFPVIFPEEGLLRIPVNMDKVSEIEAALTKYGFRITDRSVPATTDDPSYKGPERITISALYKPEKVSIQGGGAEFKGNRKGQVVAPKIPKDATDSQISKMLAEVSKDKLLDINSNVNNSFGAMMYKEGIISYVLPASDYLLKALKGVSGLYISEKTGSRQAIKIALSKGKEDEVQKFLQSYVEALQGLQKVFDGHSRVAELDLALRDKYLKDETAARASDKYTQDGLGLRETFKANNLQAIFAKMYQFFASNEDSTDQTNRVVKKDAEVPPELTHIIRRGMRDHRQGRDVDVQDFVNTFGLFPGGVDFGNWVNQSERAAHLNAIYDAMYDLADLSGISPKMLGLGQKLKMAIGAQGRGGKTAAHYIPELNEINLTKTKGDGTLGHEWHHGLDHNLRLTENGKKLMDDTVSMLSETIGVDAAEDNLRSILRNVSNSVENRNMPPKKAFFAAITNERWSTAPIYGYISKETQFRNDARELDKGENREPIYWSKPTEMLSRGFESMLFDAAKGGSPYLVSANRADGYISKKNGYAGTAYPTGDERPGLNEIFKQMLSQIDPDTLKVKTYKMETKIVKIEDLGYAVLDQYNLDSGNLGGLVWFKDQKEAEEAKAQRDGKERVLTPKAMQLSKVNERIISMAKRVDAIMEEMGLFKWPEIKNGSMAESMFYHMRQGWWPKNNRELAEYGVKAYLQTPELLGFDPTKDKREIDAYKIADFEGDRVKLKQTQEDFEAAAVRYVSQVITDMRAQGSDTKAIYDHIVGMYQNQPTLSVQSVLSRTNNAYSTPLPIGFVAGMLARVKSTTTVLDPTGGNGMLVVAANPQNVTTIELDPHRANNMELMQIGKVIPGDFLKEVKDLKDQEVDVVLANPPSDSLPSPQTVTSWNGKEYKIAKLDQLIAAQSLRAMANNGRAVLILGAHPKAGTITSTDKDFLNWLYSNYNVADHFEISGDLYNKNNSNFPLRVLVIAGRNQTDNTYPNDFVVNRITTFDELWSRYVQASDRSEEVLVGSRKKQPATGGANKPAGGVPQGDTSKDGEIGTGVGAGEGAGVGEPVSTGGRGAGTTATGGRGTTGAVRPGEQQPDIGDGERGGPGGIEAGGPEVSADSSGGPESELGGLSDLDLDNIFDNLGKKEKTKGGPRAPRGETTGGPRAPRGPSVKGPAAIPKELEGLGLEDLLKELDEALSGKAPKVSTKPTQPDSQERLDKQANEALGRVAQNTKNTSDDPSSGLYSRKGDQDYANVQPIIQQIWKAVSQKIKDTAKRINEVYELLVKRYGDAIKGHLRTFVDSLRSEVKRRPKNQTPIISDAIDNDVRVVYLGKSRFASDGIYLPRAQSQYAYTALEKLEAQVGDIDEFVAKELGYSSVEKMAKGLAGYQIDGLALAIQANKLGKGFIIGDDTGVGKGRAAAAMIVWAKKNGKIPIFVTVGKDLYSSMYEDLYNIGHGDIKIGMTNTNSIIKKDIGNGKTKTVFQNQGKDGANLISYIAQNGALPKGMDVLFTAYSQLNGGAGSPARQNAIASLVAAGKAVLIMDEAHNAAGIPTNPESMGQNAFFMSLLTGKNLLGKGKDAPENWKPPSAVYLSATFAKRPDNMPLYIHTNLRYAANTPEELTLLFGKGVKTDVLQQISSEMLVESGSMLRRERSYEGVEMYFPVDEDNAFRDIREVDKVTTILRTLVNADRVLKEWVKSPEVQKSLIENLGPKGAMLAKQGQDAFTEAKGNGFTSVVHNYIGTLLLSAKTQKAVDMVVDKMNNGEKVVVGLQNTNGSALDDYVEKNGIKIGGEIPDFGWQSLLKRAIDSTKKVTLKRADRLLEDVPVDIPYSMMPQFVKDGYDNLGKMLKDFQSDLPAAPIDYMRAELESKYVWTIDGKTHVGDTPPQGVKARHLVVKEVTGRSTGVDYSGDVPKYMSLDKPERVSIISSFQNGEESQDGPIDVLIINSAGATGISLHASVEAFDQRPRHMIILQPHGDISVFTQLLGRIHRTGQVALPSFSMLATAIPAERRILAMLRKKLQSLKSNTSGGSSSTKVKGVDFINRYGDVATSEYLNEHPEIAVFLGTPSYVNPEDAAGTDLAHKASGTAGLLASVDQQEFFDSIEASYTAAIELRNATGTNALERRVLPLNAEMIKENLIEEGLDNSNPFLTDVVMAQFNVDVIGSIPTKQNIQDDIAQALNGRTPQQVVEEIDTDLNTIFVEVRNQIILKQQALSEAIAKPEATEKDKTEFTRQKEALDIQFATLGERRAKTLDALKNTFAIGTGFETFELNNVPASAVVIGVKVDKTRIGKSKTGNPYSPSNFQVILKRNIPDGRVDPSLATLEGKSINRSEPTRRYSLDDWFALRSVTGGRTNRYIALGNILRAAQLFDKDGGEVAKFTMQGQLEDVSGVVMPAKYKPVAISAQPIRLRSPNAAVQYVLAAWNQMLQTKYENTQIESYKEVIDKLQPLMLPGLPDFAPFGEAQKNAYEINVAYGADRAWVLKLDAYRPTNFKLTISSETPKPFHSSPELKTLVPKMTKERGGNYEMERGSYITDPDKLVALVKFLHKSYPATVEADAAPLAREVMSVEFKDSESKKGLLSRAVSKGGQSVAAVQSQIVPIEGITVKVVQSSDNLPDTAAPSDVEGAWYSGNTVYLVADNLPTAQRVQEVLAHEAIGHAALEAMLGPDMMKELVKNVQALEKTSNIVKKIAAQVDRTQPGISAERRAKEIVAMMAERGLQNGLIKRIVQAVRTWLRKAGFTIQFSDGDVLALLRNAEKYVGGRFEAKGEGLYSVNYRGAPATLATWQAADELKLTDTFIQKYVDKNIDTKRVIEAIKNAEGNIRDAWDPYLKEELFHGRTAKQTIDFLKNDLRPLLEDMAKKRGVTLEDFNNYLHYRHAKVRNEVIADRDPTKPDGGSGLFNSEVDEYMAALDKTPEIKKAYEELAEKIDSIIEETQNLLVSSGLEKQSTINNWRETFPFYVPLNREEDELDFVNASSGMGQGFAVSGPFSKAAIGSFKTVKDIIGSIALQRERAIVRAEKARVGRALYALAIQNPNPTFWMPINPDAIKNKTKLIQEMVGMDMSPADAENIIQEVKSGKIDEKTGLVKYQINPMMRYSPNVMPVRINGEDRFVFFNPGNPNAKRMVESLKNLDAQKMDEVLNGIAEITRFIAAASTQYNPVFGAFNFVRDIQGAAINLSSTPIADRKLQVIGDSAKAVRAIYRSLRGKEALTPAMQEWIDLFERFQKAGGQTGFREQFSRGKGKETIVARELARLDRGNVKKAAYAVFDWLSDYNDAMENAVRLSAFKAALDSGMSEDQSASLAKNITVNFNRKGANTQTIGALYAFFNASVQGTARLVQTLFTKDKEGKMSLSSVGKKIVAGGMLLGAAQAVILAMAGFGADDPPEWVKSKNLIIPTGDGGYLTIPMPLGFNIFPNVARLVSEYMLVQSGAMSGKRDLKKTITYISSSVLGAVNPLGTSTFAQTLAPTAVDPLIGIAENKDAFGRPISKEDRALAPTPGYLRSRDSANGLFQGLAYGLNYITGGGDKGIGLFSPTADQLSYATGQYTGGVGKLAVQTAEYAKAKVIGEELQPYQVPIAGKMYGDINTPAAISGKFYENIIEMSKHENIIKEMKGKGVSEYFKENPEARLWQRANYVENEIAKLKKERKALKERNAPDAQIKRKDENIKHLMETFNKEVTKRQ